MNYCYSNDLWLGFDTIIRHFNVERNMMKKIMYIISEKKNIEFEYAEQLSNLYSFYQKNKISNEEEYSLHKAFNVFFEEIKKESELHLKNVLSIENNIIKETNKLINEQDRESILKVQTDRMRYEIWDKKSPINGITAKEIIKSRNYKIDKAYLIYIDNNLIYFQDHNPNESGYVKMNKKEAEKLAIDFINKKSEEMTDNIIVGKVIETILS